MPENSPEICMKQLLEQRKRDGRALIVLESKSTSAEIIGPLKKLLPNDSANEPESEMAWYYEAALKDGHESYELGRRLQESGLLELAHGGVEEPQNSESSWFDTPPTEQGFYWHWSGSLDDAPVVLSVLYSGTNKQCFVSAGQYGIKNAIYCDKYGGWWAECKPPELPDV